MTRSPVERPTYETSVRSFAERVGGRWAISVQGFLINATIGLIGLTIDVATLGGDGYAVAMTAYVVVFVFIAGASFLLHRTRWSQRHEVPVPVHEVTIFIVVSGVATAGAFALVQWRFDVETGVGSIEGFLVYPIISVWLGFSSIVYLDVIDRARRLRENVIAAHASLDQVRERARNAVEEMRRLIDDTVSPAVEGLRTVAANEAPSVVSAEIRDVVDESVRSVSHDLWARADERVARIGFTDLMRDIIFRPRLRVWPIMGLVIFLPLIDSVGNGGISVVLPYLVASILLYLECTTANRLMYRWPRWRLLVMSATLTVFVSQQMLSQSFADSWGYESTDLGWVTVTVYTILLVLVTSMLGSYRDLDDRRAHRLASDVRADHLDAMAEARLVAEETRRLAALLHGRVQSRLLGCAMAIDFAGDDPRALETALERTFAVLGTDWSDDESPDVVSNESLRSALGVWDGLATIEVSGDREMVTSTDPDLVVVVEELVANAVRHGGAQRVDVHLEHDGVERVVTVSDDGGSAVAARPGLGTAILERVGSVDRRESATGWTVTVRLGDRSGDTTRSR